jgi:DNA-binding transcriptional regulator YiaG
MTTEKARSGATAGHGTLSLPRVDAALIRSTRRELDMTRAGFADRLGINRRTLERWEQGRSRPGREASALILLVRAYRDTLDRLASLARRRQVAKPRRHGRHGRMSAS